jgi:hypothetical protein
VDKGGTDRYHNLILVNKSISTRIDETDVKKINQYKEGIELEKKPWIDLMRFAYLLEIL